MRPLLPKIPFPLTLAALILSSCGAPKRDDVQLVDSVRVQVEKILRAESLDGWNNWTRGTRSRTDSIHQASPGVFTAENIAAVARLEAREPDHVQKKRLRFLRRHLTFGLLDRENAALRDQVNNIESRAIVQVGGERIPFREVPVRIANERDKVKRAALNSARDSVLDSLNTILTQIQNNNRRLATHLGYASYNALVESLKETSVQQFRTVAERILAETRESYSKLLADILKDQLKMGVRDFRRHDIGRLIRNERFDRYYPGDRMRGVLENTYAAMGIDVGAYRALTVDAGSLPEKNPRAVCFPVEVPNDIRLSIKPVGGFDDYAALFHEAGHALHYLNTREHALEFKYLGDRTVTETFAFLSEYILSNQAWLRLNTRMPTPQLKDLVKFNAFHRLYYIRRYAAKFLYELELHNGAPALPELYVRMQSDAVGFSPIPSDEKWYLMDVDAHYYSMDYLRAWFLEAQLSARLIERYGFNWFEHPEAGAYLKSLWATGDRLSGDELAAKIGYDAVQPDALLKGIIMMTVFAAR